MSPTEEGLARPLESIQLPQLPSELRLGEGMPTSRHADTFQGLVAPLVLSRLDCGNATIAGRPANLLS